MDVFPGPALDPLPIGGVPAVPAVLPWSARIALRVLSAHLGQWQHGRLSVHLPDGTTREVGRATAVPHVTVRVHDARFLTDFLLRGDLGAGESYMRGDWSTDALPAFIGLAVRNADAVGRDTWFTRLVTLPATIGHWCRANTRAGSRRNIGAHYDLSNELFGLFLDETMAYSSAVFASADEPLATAQRRKFDRLCDLLALSSGDHLLEIGCGWGGFAIHAARTRGCLVTGITISEEQFRLARHRVAEAGLSDRVDIQRRDYRDLDGTYTAIAAIEMIEAVGREHWGGFFAACDRVLAPGGRVALQAITVPDHRFADYARTADWIQNYIFPGSLLGSIGGFIEAMRPHSRLTIRHVDDIATHYAETLARWRQSFLARLPEVRALGFDERFVRMWDFYLASCEAYFRTRHIAVLQMTLARAGDGAPAWGRITMRPSQS
jgi:cyclopropane-fatty-acyl-phospholipid synthase